MKDQELLHSLEIKKAEIATADGLRASHDIMMSLEKCKSSSEYIIDYLPDIFAIITKEGRILKGNNTLAKCMNKNLEKLIENNIYDLFHGETKTIFKTKLEAFPDSANELSFELPIGLENEKKDLEYSWSVSHFEELSTRRGRLFRVLGREISKIREYEKKIAQIFTAIPLGIVTFYKKGMIEWPYSQYSEYLLETGMLDGKNIKGVLFDLVWSDLSENERISVSQLISSIGSDPIEFEIIKPHLPKEIYKKNYEENRGLWLGISYYPIIHENIVDKIMLIIEDRTDIVKARKFLEIQKNIEDSRLKRIIEIQECNSAILELTFTDLDNIIPKFKKGLEDNNSLYLARVLHVLKSIARTAGFTYLKELTHACEETILSPKFENRTTDWQAIKEESKNILKEIDDLRSVCFALTGKNNSLQITNENYNLISISFEKVNSASKLLSEDQKNCLIKIKRLLGMMKKDKIQNINELKDVLNKYVERLNFQKEKNLYVDYTFKTAFLSSENFKKLENILNILIKNAVEHGIETTKERKAKNKAYLGKINVSTQIKEKFVLFKVEDDGAGIDSDKVINLAIANNYIPSKKKHFSREDLVKIITKPGFSTKANGLDIIGQGVGLKIATDIIKSLGGDELKINSQKDRGSQFSFELPINLFKFTEEKK